ncbi:hypothetical protein C8J56DRAFT_1053729 [Mycena floridula]|nr:hypothetical protein C8J56DRAFT_1053729 [Mycena floridula]
MSFTLTGAACDLKCWLAFWPWANKDSGVKGMFWSPGCITSHVVVVPWRFRMDNESYPTARHLQTWDFVEEPRFSLGRHLTANVVLSEQTAEPGSLPRRYALFSKLDAQFVTEREHYGYGIPNDVNQAFTRFMGFAGAQWMGNVLIIRIDAADRPVNLSSKDEVRISALVYRAFTEGVLDGHGVVLLPRKPRDVRRLLEPLPLELCTIVASMLPFRDKVTLHKTSYIWRAATIMVIKARIHRILREFFGVHSFQVIQVIRAHTVAIFGSMGQMVM